jgi:uncharacterized membrane protein YgdD (TMEM256/DUF423 family)
MVLPGFTEALFEHEGAARTVHRRGAGPGVVIMHELPGLIPEDAALGRRVADAGFTVFMPDLIGTPGRPDSCLYDLESGVRMCIGREFNVLATRQRSPITDWLRALCRSVHAELGGSGVGAVGMCLTGSRPSWATGSRGSTSTRRRATRTESGAAPTRSSPGSWSISRATRRARRWTGSSPFFASTSSRPRARHGPRLDGRRRPRRWQRGGKRSPEWYGAPAMERTYYLLASLLGFLGVALGAFGAHGLKARLAGLADREQRLAWWQTGAQYHLLHALAVGLAGAVAARAPGGTVAGWLFLGGIALFSGSLYAMTLTGVRKLGAVTPIGGLLLLAGWGALGAAALAMPG